jgi:hypothetical protein
MTRTEQENDQIHVDAWQDTGDGYHWTGQRGAWTLNCLWCDYRVTAPTKLHASGKYEREHEQPIIDRWRSRLAEARS